MHLHRTALAVYTQFSSAGSHENTVARKLKPGHQTHATVTNSCSNTDQCCKVHCGNFHVYCKICDVATLHKSR